MCSASIDQTGTTFWSEDFARVVEERIALQRSLA
jgi:hypothetical protein